MLHIGTGLDVLLLQIGTQIVEHIVVFDNRQAKCVGDFWGWLVLLDDFFGLLELLSEIIYLVHVVVLYLHGTSLLTLVQSDFFFQPEDFFFSQHMKFVPPLDLPRQTFDCLLIFDRTLLGPFNNLVYGKQNLLDAWLGNQNFGLPIHEFFFGFVSDSLDNSFTNILRKKCIAPVLLLKIDCILNGILDCVLHLLLGVLVVVAFVWHAGVFVRFCCFALLIKTSFAVKCVSLFNVVNFVLRPRFTVLFN